MIIKKAFGKVIGADFTKTEEKAIEIEVNRRLAEGIKTCTDDIDASVLYVLNEEFGFGEKRLKQFYDKFVPILEGLVGHYELDQGDRTWICRQKLLEKGINISKWGEEN